MNKDNMDNIKDLFHQADKLFQNKNYSEAKDIYLSILDISKDKYDNIKCFAQIAECSLHKKDFDNTLLYYNKSFDLEAIPDNILRLINICFTLKHFDLTIHYIKLLIETIKKLEHQYNNSSVFLPYYEEAVSFLRILSDNLGNNEAKDYLEKIEKQI